MDEKGLQILFFGVWIIFGITFAYRLLFTPDWIDQYLEQIERKRRRSTSSKESRLVRYRFVGVILLLSTLFTITYVIQAFTGVSR